MLKKIIDDNNKIGYLYGEFNYYFNISIIEKFKLGYPDISNIKYWNFGNYGKNFEII